MASVDTPRILIMFFEGRPENPPRKLIKSSDATSCSRSSSTAERSPGVGQAREGRVDAARAAGRGKKGRGEQERQRGEGA